MKYTAVFWGRDACPDHYTFPSIRTIVRIILQRTVRKDSISMADHPRSDGFRLHLRLWMYLLPGRPTLAPYLFADGGSTTPA